HHQLHVLADRLYGEAAGLQDRIAPEDAESAGDDQQRIEKAERHTSAEEGADVLDGLEEREHRRARGYARDAAIAHIAAVDDADHAAAGERAVGLFEEWFDG